MTLCPRDDDQLVSSEQVIYYYILFLKICMPGKAGIYMIPKENS